MDFGGRDKTEGGGLKLAGLEDLMPVPYWEPCRSRENKRKGRQFKSFVLSPLPQGEQMTLLMTVKTPNSLECDGAALWEGVHRPAWKIESSWNIQPSLGAPLGVQMQRLVFWVGNVHGG